MPETENTSPRSSTRAPDTHSSGAEDAGIDNGASSVSENPDCGPDDDEILEDETFRQRFSFLFPVQLNVIDDYRERRLTVPDWAVGSLIGRAGSTVRVLEAKHTVRIQFRKNKTMVRGSARQVVTVKGPSEAVLAATTAMNRITRAKARQIAEEIAGGDHSEVFMHGTTVSSPPQTPHKSPRMVGEQDLPSASSGSPTNSTPETSSSLYKYSPTFPSEEGSLTADRPVARSDRGRNGSRRGDVPAAKHTLSESDSQRKRAQFCQLRVPQFASTPVCTLPESIPRQGAVATSVHAEPAQAHFSPFASPYPTSHGLDRAFHSSPQTQFAQYSDPQQADPTFQAHAGHYYQQAAGPPSHPHFSEFQQGSDPLISQFRNPSQQPYFVRPYPGAEQTLLRHHHPHDKQRNVEYSRGQAQFEQDRFSDSRGAAHAPFS